MARNTNNTAAETRTVTSEEARFLLKAAAVDAKRPVFLWGPMGIGKSDLVQSIGDEIDALVIDVRMALLDPTDIRGIGFYNVDTKTMDWAPPVDLPTASLAAQYKHVILFLDEMNSAPPAVQAAAYQLILNRRIGQYVLPDNVSIIAAGNRETDKGVTYKMPAPLANRFVHFEMRVDFDSWLNWAITHDVDSNVVGYLSEHKTDLFDFEPTSSSRAFATPRSWAFVSELMKTPMSDAQVMNMISGTVGEGIATKFNAHRKWAGKLPTAADVLDGKAKVLTKELENVISAQYTLIINLCYELKDRYEKYGKTNEGNEKWHGDTDNMLSFMLNNMSAELTILGARTALATYKLPFFFKKLKNWDEFNKKYGRFIISAVE